jgi:hypothetical protein
MDYSNIYDCVFFFNRDLWPECVPTRGLGEGHNTNDNTLPGSPACEGRRLHNGEDEERYLEGMVVTNKGSRTGEMNRLKKRWRAREEKEVPFRRAAGGGFPNCNIAGPTAPRRALSPKGTFLGSFFSILSCTVEVQCLDLA